MLGTGNTGSTVVVETIAARFAVTTPTVSRTKVSGYMMSEAIVLLSTVSMVVIMRDVVSGDVVLDGALKTAVSRAIES